MRLFLAIARLGYDIGVLARALDRFDVLVSAGLFWNGVKLPRRRRPGDMSRKVGTVLVDSGAQQFSHRFMRYPYGTEYYAEWGDWMGAGLIASLDVPLDVFEWKRVRYDHRRLLDITVCNAVRLYELWRDGGLRATPLLVIQGLRNEWFVECMDMYADAGLLRRHDHWAIGSLCFSRFAGPRKIRWVTATVRRRLGRRAWLHVFGPDMSSWGALVGLVDSIDTSIWRTPRARRIFPGISTGIIGGRMVRMHKGKRLLVGDRAPPIHVRLEGGRIADWRAWHALQAYEVWKRFEEACLKARPRQTTLGDFIEP